MLVENLQPLTRAEAQRPADERAIHTVGRSIALVDAAGPLVKALHE
jgi:hypothetical protein